MATATTTQNKRQKSSSNGDDVGSSNRVYLVTKSIDISVEDFGDVEQAYPDNDYIEQSEELVRENIEEKIVENYRTIYGSYEKAFNKAKELFVETKTYVNSLGVVNDDDEEERDTDLDPAKYVVNPMLIENTVDYSMPMPKDAVVKTDETNYVSAHIKIIITEMELDLS